MSTQSIEDLNSRRQSDGKFGRKTHPDAEHVPGLRAPIPDDLDTHEERCEWIARQHGFKVDVAGSENSGIIPLRLTRANGKSIDLDWDTGLYGRETPSPGDVVEVRDPDRGASTEVVLGEMVPFDELKFLDTTALFTYQPVSRS